MSYFAEGCLTGHYWDGSSICSVCGERLRCGCGRFVRQDNLAEHLRTCAVVEKLANKNEDAA